MQMGFEKCQLRNYLKEIRKNIPPFRREEASRHACEQLSSLCESYDRVLSFASFGSEINLWPLNQELCKKGKLLLPYTTVEGFIIPLPVTDINLLRQNQRGIKEPVYSDCDSSTLKLLGCILVPGLGFDTETKHRLGYGGGCYDRFLASYLSLYSIGVGYKEQAIYKLPYTQKDVCLKEIYLF